MNARKVMKPKKAAKAVAPKKVSPATKGAKRSSTKASFESDEAPTAKRPKPAKTVVANPGKTKAATTSPGKAKAATTSPGKAKAATTSPGKAKAATTSPGKAKAAAPASKSKAGVKKAAAVEPKRKARGAAEPESESAIEIEEIDVVRVTDDEAELEENSEAGAGTISEDDDALDEAAGEADSGERGERRGPLTSDISEIRGLRDADDEDLEALRAEAERELGADLSADSQPAPTTRAHLKRVVESLIFVADQAVTANQLARLVKAKQAEVREVVTEIMRDYDGRGIELVEVGGGFQFRSAAASAPFVRDLVSARPVRLTRAQLETLALIAYRQPITRPEIDDVRGVDGGSAIKVLLDRDLVKILGRKDEAGRPLLYGTAPQFLEFFGMKSLQDLPTLREFTELSEENRELFAKKMGEVPSDLSDPSLDPSVVHAFEYDEEGNPIVRAPEPAAEGSEDSEAVPAAETTDESADGEVSNAEPESAGDEDTEAGVEAENASRVDDSDEGSGDEDSNGADDEDDETPGDDSDDEDDTDEDSDDEDEENEDEDDDAVAMDDSDDPVLDAEDEDEDEDGDSDDDEEPDDDSDDEDEDEDEDEEDSDEDAVAKDESDSDEDEDEDGDEDEDEDASDEDESDDDVIAKVESDDDDDEDEDAEEDDEDEDEDEDEEGAGDDSDDEDDEDDEDEDDEDSGRKPS